MDKKSQFVCDVVSHPCLYFNGSLVKPPLEFGHGSVYYILFGVDGITYPCSFQQRAPRSAPSPIKGSINKETMKMSVKEQFGGHELYKEIEGIVWVESTCLESIGLSLWIDILFIAFTLRFDVEFSSVAPERSTRTLWWLPSRLWRHNASARELSANHTSRWIKMQVHETSRPIIHCNAYAVGNESNMAVDEDRAASFHQQVKTFKNTHVGPFVLNHFVNLLLEV